MSSKLEKHLKDSVNEKEMSINELLELIGHGAIREFEIVNYVSAVSYAKYKNKINGAVEEIIIKMIKDKRVSDIIKEKINIKVKKEHTATPNYLTPDILGSAEAAKVALINESMHLLRNTLSVVTKGLYLSYSDITSGLNPVEVIKKRSEINEINFDKLYITRFKSLYNEIVSFSMKFQNLNENDTKIFNGIRRTAVECAEILKDMRNIEPNFFKYLQSDNEYICGEYNNFACKC